MLSSVSLKCRMRWHCPLPCLFNSHLPVCTHFPTSSTSSVFNFFPISFSLSNLLILFPNLVWFLRSALTTSISFTFPNLLSLSQSLQFPRSSQTLSQSPLVSPIYITVSQFALISPICSLSPSPTSSKFHLSQFHHHPYKCPHLIPLSFPSFSLTTCFSMLWIYQYFAFFIIFNTDIDVIFILNIFLWIIQYYFVCNFSSRSVLFYLLLYLYVTTVQL